MAPKVKTTVENWEDFNASKLFYKPVVHTDRAIVDPTDPYDPQPTRQPKHTQKNEEKFTDEITVQECDEGSDDEVELDAKEIIKPDNDDQSGSQPERSDDSKESDVPENFQPS